LREQVWLREMGLDNVDGSGRCLICLLEADADAREDDSPPASGRRPMRWWLR
jgi:hypothetical protein